MLHSFPDNPELAFFDHPGTQRAAELCAARLAERYKDHWRSPKSVVSCASSSENPEISDPDTTRPTATRTWEFIWPDGKCSNLIETVAPSGPPRASHDLLISNTFAFHPLFGTGHVLRTNGVICMFWTGGQTVEIVEQKNLCFLRLILAGERAGTPRQRRLAAAMTED